MTETALNLPLELLRRCRVLPDRTDILRYLPRDIVFAEIGVALGDFTQKVLEHCEIAHFYGIDIFTLHHYPHTWEGRVGEILGDATHRQHYESRFADRIAAGRMTVLEGDSATLLEMLPDRGVDVFYVDADHAYEAVRRELSVIRRKIAPGGLIILNDYTMFDQFRMVPYGVPRAAHEFMVEHGWEAVFLALHPDMFCDLVIRESGRPPVLRPGGKEVAPVHDMPSAAARAPAPAPAPAAAPPGAPHIVHAPDAQVGLRARTVLGLLRPMYVLDGRLVRRGRPNDGGYVMLDDEGRDGIAYSLGISDDVSWDLEMAQLGCTIFQYDHTVPGPPVADPRFHFARTGIAAEASADGVFRTLDSLVEENGHAARDDMILKMDIKGHEWDVLAALAPGKRRLFSQILLEMHRFVRIDDEAHYEKVVAVLRALNEDHQCIHVHANNYGWIGMLGGVMMPDTLEVTFVRRAGHRFGPCFRSFPTDLDMPCNPDAADIFLGPLGQIEPPC